MAEKITAENVLDTIYALTKDLPEAEQHEIYEGVVLDLADLIDASVTLS